MTMKYAAVLATVIFCSTAYAEQPSSQFSASQYGYAETTQSRDLLIKDISKSNDILSESAFHLVPNWLPHTADSGTVPVYLIRNDIADMIFVPRNCFCVVVVPQMLAPWLVSNSPDTNDLAVEDSAIVAFILLHEVGHLAHHDNFGASFTPIPTDARNLNFEKTSAKDIEFGADAWAASKVRDASQPGKLGFESAMDIELAIANASWNLQRRRLVQQYCEILGSSLIKVILIRISN
jgi:hypothetical protein